MRAFLRRRVVLSRVETMVTAFGLDNDCYVLGELRAHLFGLRIPAAVGKWAHGC